LGRHVGEQLLLGKVLAAHYDGLGVCLGKAEPGECDESHCEEFSEFHSPSPFIVAYVTREAD
jgi:hypothetical protein